MPMEVSLEFMAVVGSDFANAKREFFDDVIDEVYGAGLSVFLVDFYSETDSRRGISTFARPWHLIS